MVAGLWRLRIAKLVGLVADRTRVCRECGRVFLAAIVHGIEIYDDGRYTIKQTNKSASYSRYGIILFRVMTTSPNVADSFRYAYRRWHADNQSHVDHVIADWSIVKMHISNNYIHLYSALYDESDIGVECAWWRVLARRSSEIRRTTRSISRQSQSRRTSIIDPRSLLARPIWYLRACVHSSLVLLFIGGLSDVMLWLPGRSVVHRHLIGVYRQTCACICVRLCLCLCVYVWCSAEYTMWCFRYFGSSIFL